MPISKIEVIYIKIQAHGHHEHHEQLRILQRQLSLRPGEIHNEVDTTDIRANSDAVQLYADIHQSILSLQSIKRHLTNNFS